MSDKYRAVTWTNPRCEVRPTGVKGTGVFACAPIIKGEIVQMMGGRVVSWPEVLHAFSTAGEYIDTVQLDDELHLLLNYPKAHGARYSFNHSCDSNLWMDDNVTLSARRDIEAGEEITVDYALCTADADYAMEVPCLCGSPDCRGTMRGSDWQLPSVQARYRGHFSPFLNRRIEQMNNSCYAPTTIIVIPNRVRNQSAQKNAGEAVPSLYV